jgi:hypothetical protein
VTESHNNRKFADELVSQDIGVSQFDFGGFRMNLEKTLDSLERRGRSVRRASVVAMALCFVMWVLLFAYQSTEFKWVMVVSVIGLYVSLLAAGVLLTLYLLKYRPALERARSDLQISMIADMQRQIAALSSRLDDRDE